MNKTDYLLESANIFSAEIDDLKKKNLTNTNNISTIQTQVGNINTDLGTINNSIGSINGDISTINGNITTITNDLSNPNFLLNSDFSVNQRGQTTYTGSNVYTADRWQLTSGEFNVSTKTLRIASQYGALVQKIFNYEKYAGKTITISAKITAFSTADAYRLLIRDGSNRTYSINKTGVLSYTYTLPASISQLRIGLMYVNSSGNDTISFDYIKCEFGDKATKFVPRNYDFELNECKKYYQIINFKNNQTSFYFGFNTSSTAARLFVPLNMVQKPTLTVSSANHFGLLTSNGYQTLTSLTMGQFVENGINLNCVSQSLTAGNATSLYVINNTAYLKFEAEMY